MKLRRLERQQALGGSPSRAMLANYLNAIADLDGPKRSLPLLDDSARLEAYRRGLQNALKEQPGLPAFQRPPG